MTPESFVPNPLNVHNIRILSYCPAHFSPVDFNIKTKPDKIDTWIYENLQGRFFSGSWVVNNDGKSTILHRVAFESPNEAMYFLLALPEINKFSI